MSVSLSVCLSGVHMLAFDAASYGEWDAENAGLENVRLENSGH